MQINNNPTYQFLNSSTSSTNSEKINNNQKITQPESSSNQSITNYDVRHMSPNEMRDMATELYDTGKISEEDRINFSIQSFIIENYGGTSANTKIDMVNFFQEQVEVIKSTPDSSKGVEFYERSLSILKGLNASSNANLPRSV